MNHYQVFAKLPKSAVTGKPVLHFAHANGFVNECYQPILDTLAHHFTIETLSYLGTHPNYPVDNHWQSLTRQVADSILDACDKHQVPTVVVVGHSVGAVTSLQSLIDNPKPISQAVLLDPSILTDKNSLIYELAKWLDKPMARWLDKPHHLIDKLSPAKKSKYRKELFASKEVAYQALKSKPLFAKFDERCFANYIEYGLTAQADGTATLTIPKMTEVAIFRTIPSLYWLKSIRPARPVQMIVGANSHFGQMGSYRTLAKDGLHIQTVAGSHLFPLEYPDACATQILQAIASQITP